MDLERIAREKDFHDRWAAEAEQNLPEVVKTNEALTSPELRYIHSTLGSLRGKRIMDLGCGLGEASVYFAMQGATVTAVDLSPEMLRATQILAEQNKVTLKTHAAAAENLNLQPEDKFDVIYVGNLFHHVNIEDTMDLLMPHFEKDGRLVSWDPLAYNPIINVYRKIATEVRTVDEHPLKRRDVKLIMSHFANSRLKFFWFFTLAIFLVMAIVQRRNPNKVRFWKAVVDESDRWAWIYRPLAAMDNLVLKILPPLKWLCWNVVIIADTPVKLEKKNV